MINRMISIAVLFFSMLCSGVAFSATDYPARQIEVVVPFPPGGTVDLGIRIFSEGLSKKLGVPIVISNKSGGSGVAGAEYVANAKPDGYTLLGPSNTVLVFLPLMNPSLSYKWTDFTPIIRTAKIPFVIFTKGDSPFNKMSDIAAVAKKNPGKLNYGIVGVGGPTHFIVELWREKMAVDVNFIPYQGGAPLLTAQLGGHLDFGVINLPPIYGLVQSGKVKVIAATSKLKELPQVPTFAEIGVPESNIFMWLSLLAPGKTPKEIVDKLAMASEKTLEDPVIVEKLEKIGYTIEPMNAKVLAGAIDKEFRDLSRVAEKVKKASEKK